MSIDVVKEVRNIYELTDYCESFDEIQNLILGLLTKLELDERRKEKTETIESVEEDDDDEHDECSSSKTFNGKKIILMNVDRQNNDISACEGCIGSEDDGVCWQLPNCSGDDDFENQSFNVWKYKE